jgi:hypothetical protein
VRGDRNNEVRRKSMLGTVLFVFGSIGVVIFLITRSNWVAVAAVACLLPGAIMLYQVGRSLP